VVRSALTERAVGQVGELDDVQAGGPELLGFAACAFGIEFLEEVQERMSDYGSAAGQSPAGISMSGDLADEATAEPARRRPGRVKAALNFLAATSPEATEIAKALEAWEPILHQLAR
jgi:hypothetical protein